MRRYTTLLAASVAKAITSEPRVIKRHAKKPGYYVMSPSEANRCISRDGWSSLTERLTRVEYLTVQMHKIERELREAIQRQNQQATAA